MDWTLIATLLLRYGPEFVESILSKIQNNTPVTLEEWIALKSKIAIGYDDLGKK